MVKPRFTAAWRFIFRCDVFWSLPKSDFRLCAPAPLRLGWYSHPLWLDAAYLSGYLGVERGVLGFAP